MLPAPCEVLGLFARFAVAHAAAAAAHAAAAAAAPNAPFSCYCAEHYDNTT
jgi:hypothetical protein